MPSPFQAGLNPRGTYRNVGRPAWGSPASVRGWTGTGPGAGSRAWFMWPDESEPPATAPTCRTRSTPYRASSTSAAPAAARRHGGWAGVVMAVGKSILALELGEEWFVLF